MKLPKNPLILLIIGIFLGFAACGLLFYQNIKSNDIEINMLRNQFNSLKNNTENSQIFNNNIACKEISEKFIKEERDNPGYPDEYVLEKDTAYSTELNSCILNYLMVVREGNIRMNYYTVRNLSTEEDIYSYTYKEDKSVNLFDKKHYEDLAGSREEYNKIVNRLFHK